MEGVFQMKKKVFAIVLCMIMVMITGCGKSDMMVLTPNGDAVIQSDGTSQNTASESKSDDTKQEEAKEEKKEETKSDSSSSGKIHVGFAQVGSESGWRLAQTQSMKETFTEANGYQLDFVDCNNDQKTQIDALSKFVQDKVDYIILDPIVEDGYDDVLKEAKNANIPVIVVDRNISADASLYTCWIGSDFEKEGEQAGKWLEKYLKEQKKDSEDINILTILGSDGASAAIGRTDGFEAIAKKHDNWKLLDKKTGDFTKDGGNAVMKTFLKKYDDIDVLVCQNDDEAFGAVEAIKEAGKTCGPDGDITVISFDATGDGFKAMIAGDINVDVECNPLEGSLVGETIQKLNAGEKVDAIQYTKEEVFPAEKAEEILPSRAY